MIGENEMESKVIFMETDSADGGEILVIIKAPATCTTEEINSLFNEPDKMRRFEMRDGERIYC